LASAQEALLWALQNPQAAAGLLADLGEGPVGLAEEANHWIEGLFRVARALQAGRDVLAGGGRPAQALWEIWGSSDWPDRLRARSLRGGPAGLRADADLDAVIGLFEFAARMPAQVRGGRGGAALAAAVRSQEVPIDLRAGHHPARDAVTVASAHAARGRSWQLVVLAGVQEGVWPDGRPRSQLLQTDQLGQTQIVDKPSVADTVAGERRLFYSACTRASRHLVVTAVADATARPSRFLVEMGVPIQSRADVRLPGVSAAGVVSRLRALCASSDPAVARAAHDRLARLAQARDSAGRPLVPLADPGSWWFARPTTTAEVAHPGRIVLSGSTVAAVEQCPLRWFLDRRCAASPPAGPAVGVGLLVHQAAQALCALPGSYERPREELLAELEQLVTGNWDRIDFPAGYQERAERRRVSQMLGTLVDWHQKSSRRSIATEHRFDVGLVAAGHRVRLVGSIDRVDLGPDGSLHLVDFKTGRNPCTRQAAQVDPQLGVYQLAVRRGALGRLGGGADAAGAELVYLAAPKAADGMPTTRLAPALPPGPGWADELVGRVAGVLAGGKLVARVSQACQTCNFQQLCPAWVGGDDEEIQE
jgi:RecB family exonuclease